MDAEKLAQRFHEIYESLAPSFGYETREESRKPWGEVPEENKRLMIAVCRVVLAEVKLGSDAGTIHEYLERTSRLTPQALASDRNGWQRRLGVLITRVETFVAETSKSGVAPHDCKRLLNDVYAAVNTNMMTGSASEEPYADIASLTVRDTLESAIAAGLVQPGPNAPNWMKD